MAVLLLLSQAAASVEPMRKPLAGQWSAGAAYLWPGRTAVADYPPGGRAIRLTSPDGTKRLFVSDETMKLQLVGEERALAEAKIGDLAEVLWSPDSQAFAVTQSDGGWVGTWDVVVYRITPSGLQRREVTKQASKEFLARPAVRANSCNIEHPNVGAIAWIDGSRGLVLLAESPPHSSACEQGVRGYVVDVDTGVVQIRYSETNVFKGFPWMFGWRFTEGASKE